MLLTFKNISLFHRWFYGLAKVGIMQRGKFCSVNFSPADAAESPKNKNWTKKGIKMKYKHKFQNVFQHTLTKTQLNILKIHIWEEGQNINWWKYLFLDWGDGGRGVPEGTKENNYPNPLTVCSIKRSLISWKMFCFCSFCSFLIGETFYKTRPKSVTIQN